MPPTAFEQRIVERFAGCYGTEPPNKLTWFTATASPETAGLVLDGKIRRGQRLLEIGCGPGVEACFYANHGLSVTGVDLSEDAIKLAKALAGLYGVTAEFVQGDALALPLPDESFDVVTDSFIFHNVRDESRAPYARQIFRVLKPGGLFVVRAFSDQMTPGTGPRRITSDDLISTFSSGFSLEEARRTRGFPTEKRPEQWHWFALWTRRQTWGAPPLAEGP